MLDVVLGQSISMGQEIGQINDLSDFKIVGVGDKRTLIIAKTELGATFDRQDAQYALRVESISREMPRRKVLEPEHF